MKKIAPKDLKQAVEEANARLRLASMARNQLESQYTALVVAPEIRKAIGTCYRYRNSYSSDRHWWLYMKIVGERSGEAVVVTFQTDTNGKMDAERDTERWPLRGGYHSISHQEFRKQQTAFLKAMLCLMET